MPMNDRVVHMRVRVRLGPVPRERMIVPMVLVVPMGCSCDVASCLCSCSWCSDTCSHTPTAISAPATASCSCNGVLPDDDCQQCAEERSDREEGAGARGAQVPQRQNKQHQAHAVTQKSDRRGGDQGGRGRQRLTCRESKRGRGAATDQPLESGNDDGIACRHLSRQVVVDCPEEACSRDEQRAGRHAPAIGRPGKRDASGDDECHARGDSAIEVLAEHDPCDRRREYRLQIEQQRCRRRAAGGEAVHQQHRGKDAAADNCAREPAPIRPGGPRDVETSPREQLARDEHDVRPKPEPRYRRPASNSGWMSPTRRLASGVLAPNSAAASSA